MPNKVISFTGINRKVNEYQNSGSCEELINLRQTASGGMQVVRPKHAMVENIWHEKVYEHSWGDRFNLIVVDDIGAIIWINEDGTEAQKLHNMFSKDAELSSAGNVLVVYSPEKRKQLVFRFEDDKYESYDLRLPRIKNAKISYGHSYFNAPSNSALADDRSAASFNEAMLSAASGLTSKFTYGLSGLSVVGCTYELEDGSEIWSTAFAVANPSKAYKYEAPVIDFESKTVKVTGATDVELNLRFEDRKPKGVRRINVYSTRPIFNYKVVSKSIDIDVEIEEIPFDELNLDGQLMYYQGSVSVSKPYAVLKLKFDEMLTGEKIMDITPGCIERIGRTVSYNNRFHSFAGDVYHFIQVPTVSSASSVFDITDISISHWLAYVKFNDSWKLIDNVYDIVDGRPLDIIYPMIGVERLAFVKADMGENGIQSVPYSEMFYVDLKESSAYNYSYAFGLMPEIVAVGDFMSEIESSNQVWSQDFVYDDKVFWKKDTNAVNVSAQFNPHVFPIEYSYSFGGEIRDISTSYIPISSTQIGQYPVTVFTTGGIFAFEQGNGQVLYGSIVPIQPLVINGRALPTPYGTFFKSSKNLYVLSGRDVANVSDVLNGKIETGIRSLASYQKLCQSSEHGLYDFTYSLSRVDFDKHIEDATLAYDPLQNEVYINSGHINYEYAYVFNIASKSFHKTSFKILMEQRNGRYAIMARGAEPRSLVDLHDEEDSDMQQVLMQSRPMVLSALFSHIDRAILYVDTMLSLEGQYLCLSVFASDNLSDWKCVISSQKSGTVLSHIRTNRAARSYRYYIVLVNGTVSTDTDISSLVVDYTEVTRRLG